jgi:predicted ATPase
VLQRLADPACRLLTLVGPGGIGKTRLALAAAQQILDFGGRPPDTILESEVLPTGDNSKSKIQNPKFQDGVFFVPLQAVSAQAGLVPAIADALGFQFYGETAPKQQLLNYLQQKELLLVLDNFEQLLDGAGLVAELLANAAQIKILATSREALKLQEEWFHPLAGMRLPPSLSLLTGGQEGETIAGGQSIVTYDAVQLFVQTARRAVVDFQPTAHQEAIIRICRLVDGMPLALELAASWLKVLSCTQIAEEIERGVDILVTRHQNVPARHRSMRAVLEQAWQLLAANEQRVLAPLAVFQGGFAPEAATAIAGASLLTLADLVDKAWVYRTPDGRYQQHELLRQFAADRLASDPATATAPHARHTAYYLQFVTQYEQALIGPEQRRALDAIGIEIDNVHAAWLRAVEQDEFALVNAAQSALYLFFHTRSRYAEGQEQFVRAVQRLDQAGHGTGEWAGLRCQLLGCIGSFRLAQGEIDAADGDFAAVLENCSDPRLLAFVYNHVGNAARWRGNRPAAEAALQRSLALARTSGDDHYVAQALLGLADVASSFSDFAKGQSFARQALALCRQLGRPDLTASVLASLAWATNCLGEYAESERYYRESLTLAESIGNPFGIGLATQFLGWVAYCEGGERLPEALDYFEQSMVIFRQIGYGNHVAMVLGDYALAANEQGDFAAAQRAAQEGLAIAEKLGHHNMVAYNLNGLGGAACGLGDLASSRAHLARSLQISTELQTHDHMLVTLYFLASLFSAESQQPNLAPAVQLDKRAHALTLFATVVHQPMTWQLIRDRAQRAQEQLAAELPAEVAASAIERGKRRSLAEVGAKVLNRADSGFVGAD